MCCSARGLIQRKRKCTYDGSKSTFVAPPSGGFDMHAFTLTKGTDLELKTEQGLIADAIHLSYNQSMTIGLLVGSLSVINHLKR